MMADSETCGSTHGTEWRPRKICPSPYVWQKCKSKKMASPSSGRRAFGHLQAKHPNKQASQPANNKPKTLDLNFIPQTNRNPKRIMHLHVLIRHTTYKNNLFMDQRHGACISLPVPLRCKCSTWSSPGTLFKPSLYFCIYFLNFICFCCIGSSLLHAGFL